jgi:hypothetical protein
VGNAAYAAYVDAVRALGAAHGLPVFRRSEVMKYWLDGKRFTPATMLSAGQLHMTDDQLPLPCQTDGRCDRAHGDTGGAASRRSGDKAAERTQCRPQRRESQVKNGSNEPPAGDGGGQR